MRVPKKPPSWSQLMKSLTVEKFQKAEKMASDPAIQKFLQEVNDKYLHWDKFRFHAMPEGLEPLEAWMLVQLNRRNKQILPLTLQGKQNFSFVLPPRHLEWLEKIDRQVGGLGRIFGSLLDDNDRHLTNSLNGRSHRVESWKGRRPLARSPRRCSEPDDAAR